MVNDSLKKGVIADKVQLGSNKNVPTSNKTKSAIISSNKPAKVTAVHMSDEELIAMLVMPPKNVPFLKTKSGYQDFFKGMSRDRMNHLLTSAYGSLSDEERMDKVKKRLELLNSVLVS